MASDRQQFAQAMEKWERLRHAGQFSRAPELGMTAVIYSIYESVESDEDDEEQSFKLVESAEFANEAREIADNINAQNGDAFVIRGLTPESLEEGVLANSDVASVVIIGHGTFSSVFTDQGDSIEWSDVSRMSTHLKRGYIEQRFCGKYRFRLSVPFGLFAARSARNILAAKGKRFCPETHPQHEARIMPITTRDMPTYQQIRDEFPYQPFFKNY